MGGNCAERRPLSGPGDAGSDPPRSGKGAQRAAEPAWDGEGEEEAGPPHGSLRSSGIVAPSRPSAEGERGPGARRRGVGAAPLPRSPASLNRPPPWWPCAGVINSRVPMGRRAPGRGWWAGPCGGQEPRLGAGGRAGQPNPPAERRDQRPGRTKARAQRGVWLPAAAPETRGAAGGGGGSCRLQLGVRPRRDPGAGVAEGRGRGGAAPSPGQQRPPHKGGGATGGLGAARGLGSRSAAWRAVGSRPLRPSLLQGWWAGGLVGWRWSPPAGLGSPGGEEARARRRRAAPGRGGAGRGAAAQRTAALAPGPVAPLCFILLSLFFGKARHRASQTSHFSRL